MNLPAMISLPLLVDFHRSRSDEVMSEVGK
jgi:hypothetical protein